MATLISSIVAHARSTLLEPVEVTGGYWTDAELLVLAVDAIKDLWKPILDLYQSHIVTIDATNMAIAANTSLITGVPTDLFRVEKIRPRTLNSTNQGLVFQYRPLTHPDFVQAEAAPAVEGREQVVYYAIINAGAPVAAPAIKIAPQVSSAVPLEVTYSPVIGTLTLASNNPIPGESDRAVTSYVIAWARAKERQDRSPDPEFISIYATEKAGILTSLTPRSVQDPETVVGMWEPAAPGLFGNWGPN